MISLVAGILFLVLGIVLAAIFGVLYFTRARSLVNLLLFILGLIFILVGLILLLA